jgi:hypothetical protein
MEIQRHLLHCQQLLARRRRRFSRRREILPRVFPFRRKGSSREFQAARQMQRLAQPGEQAAVLGAAEEPELATAAEKIRWM